MFEYPPPIRANVAKAGWDMDMAALKAALVVLPVGAPVVVMIHGYRFAPNARGNCPHVHILSAEPTLLDPKAVSWPRHLGLDGKRGLAIALGWPARGTVSGAYRRAEVAGQAVAAIALEVSRLSPGRPVDVIGHSLGARAALAALPHAVPGTLRRLILLAAAETRRPARLAMDSPAGRAVEVINVTSRENDLFDFCFEWLIGLGFDSALGQGPGYAMPNWLDVQIDQPATRQALAELGHTLAAPARISHWSPYLNPGIFTLYRAFLAGNLTLPMLRAHLPAASDRRWSRLFTFRSPRPVSPRIRA